VPKDMAHILPQQCSSQRTPEHLQGTDPKLHQDRQQTQLSVCYKIHLLHNPWAAIIPCIGLLPFFFSIVRTNMFTVSMYSHW
jgi:hypothetical protein